MKKYRVFHSTNTNTTIKTTSPSTGSVVDRGRRSTKLSIRARTWESKQSLRAFVHRMTTSRCCDNNIPDDDGAAFITQHTPPKQQQQHGGGGEHNSLGASTQTATTVAIEDDDEDEQEDAQHDGLSTVPMLIHETSPLTSCLKTLASSRCSSSRRTTAIVQFYPTVTVKVCVAVMELLRDEEKGHEILWWTEEELLELRTKALHVAQLAQKSAFVRRYYYTRGLEPHIQATARRATMTVAIQSVLILQAKQRQRAKNATTTITDTRLHEKTTRPRISHEQRIARAYRGTSGHSRDQARQQGRRDARDVGRGPVEARESVTITTTTRDPNTTNKRVLARAA